MTENITPLTNENEVTDKIIVCIDGEDWIKTYEEFEVTFDSSESEIMEAVRPAIQETFGVDIYDTDGISLYKLRKASTSRNIYVIPSSVAGF